MKIAIATPDQAGSDWTPFATDFITPVEIRRRIQELLDAKDTTEIRLVTMNRTVLDLVTSTEIKCPGPLTYEDIFVWDGSKLANLLDLHSESWLIHFDLGTVFERGLLDPRGDTDG